MQNLKVKVDSVEESREAQELFFELGGDFHFGGNLYCNTHLNLVTINKDGLMANIELDGFDYTEITIPQLKDMVVLKRNNPKDATHYRVDGKEYFQTCDKEQYYHFQDDCWVLSTWMNYQLLPQLKPIQNNDLPFIDSEDDVREFLDYQGGWSYKLITSSVDGCIDRDWIEVPEGACSLTKCGDTLLFWNHDETMCMNPKTESSFRQFNYGGHAGYFKMNSHTMNKLVLWRRNPQEESLNDKVASAEEARQEMKADNVNNPSHYNKGGIECIEAIKASMTHEAFCGYLKGNIIKYTWRYEVKGGTESLQKAQWYTNRLLEELSNG